MPLAALQAVVTWPHSSQDPYGLLIMFCTRCFGPVLETVSAGEAVTSIGWRGAELEGSWLQAGGKCGEGGQGGSAHCERPSESGPAQVCGAGQASLPGQGCHPPCDRR